MLYDDEGRLDCNSKPPPVHLPSFWPFSGVANAEEGRGGEAEAEFKQEEEIPLAATPKLDCDPIKKAMCACLCGAARRGGPCGHRSYTCPPTGGGRGDKGNDGGMWATGMDT